MSILNTPEAHRLRKEHPDWDDLRIVRHIESLRALRRINEQQRRKALDDCYRAWGVQP
jgi:hypothetical protein